MATKAKPPRSPLQALFIKRVQEEMDRLGLSRKALSLRVGGPAQRTMNDIMNGADPRLESVHAVATALGVRAWELFIERSDIVKYSTVVKKFPQAPEMIGKPTIKKTDDRRKTRA